MMPRTAAQLRQAFDRTFAEPPRTRHGPAADLLAIRVHGDAYALPLAGIQGLFADKLPTRLPSAVPAFLGIAGFGGRVVPVYDLRVLLGYAGGATPRWLVVLAARPAALAFDDFDGHLRLAQEAVAPPEHNTTRPHIQGLARAGDGPAAAHLLRPIVDLGSVLGTIEQLSKGAGAPAQREKQQ
jgi:chemotaxis signal transduction protein